MSDSKSDSKIPSELLLSLATVPTLLFLLGSKALSELITDLGLVSEEVFRGDRLPTLNLSPLSDETDDQSS